MKLVTARIYEYKSIWDSNQFKIGEVTCLVGKNEAGKTALLQALYKLNPIIKEDSEFNVTLDYPRAQVSDYEEAVADEEREPAKVAEGVFELDVDDVKTVEKIFGDGVLINNRLTLSRAYPDPNSPESCTRTFSLSVNATIGLGGLIRRSNIPQELQSTLLGNTDSVDQMLANLKDVESTKEIGRLVGVLEDIRKHDVSWYIYNRLLSSRVPKFLYFDEYYQMKGHENIEALKARVTQNTLEPSDYPMLGLIGLARLDIDQLLNPAGTQDLVNKLEGAGNRLSDKVLQYWSQNKHVQMQFDVRPANPHDPEGMTSGTNIWAKIYDSRHKVSTNLGTRSRGFLWFFSFLAWYSKVAKENNRNQIILLLDEPGLFLHGRAQEDLLNYFETELKGKHQIIYTTHSPFMVDSTKFDRVRIVQDRGIETDTKFSKTEDGTKVLTEVLEAHQDSLFPLQGALGYEIYQTLFIGKNCLVVEGVSDLLYIQAMSGMLSRQGRVSLSEKWTITPVGGSDKVPTFVSLLGSQKGLKLATLIDYQKKDAQSLSNLYKRKLLKKSHLITFADFVDADEADIEDMFEKDFYINLVNREYSDQLQGEVEISALNLKQPRILVQLEKHFETNPLKRNAEFNHYRPARRLIEHVEDFVPLISDATFDRFENAFRALNELL